jgi:hypothetical protein
MLLLAEEKFRKPDAPEKTKEIYLGIDFLEGIETKPEEALGVA